MPRMNKFGKAKVWRSSYDSTSSDAEAFITTVPETTVQTTTAQAVQLHIEVAEPMELSVVKTEATDLPIAELQEASSKL